MKLGAIRVGTAVAMLLSCKLIQNTTPVFASTDSYLLPIIAVVWGLLDGETFTVWYLFGGFLILVGIYLIRENKAEADSYNEPIETSSRIRFGTIHCAFCSKYKTDYFRRTF